MRWGGVGRGGVRLGAGTEAPMQRYVVSKEQWLRCRSGEDHADVVRSRISKASRMPAIPKSAGWEVQNSSLGFVLKVLSPVQKAVVHRYEVSSRRSGRYTYTRMSQSQVFSPQMALEPNTHNRAPLMCLSGQPALKMRLAASSKRDGNEWAWVVNVAPTAAAVWVECTCKVAGDAAQNARAVL